MAPAPAAEPTPTAAAPSAEPARAPEPAAAGPEPSAAPAQDDVTERVLAVVSEETGYPTDLLDMDLDLEADLGIDTVKQAEVFASIRESYDIPFDDALKLRDYPTLNHVVAFVRERAGIREEGPAPVAPDEGAPAAAAQEVGEPKRFPRRVPVPIVRPGARALRADGSLPRFRPARDRHAGYRRGCHRARGRSCGSSALRSLRWTRGQRTSTVRSSPGRLRVRCMASTGYPHSTLSRRSPSSIPRAGPTGSASG